MTLLCNRRLGLCATSLWRNEQRGRRAVAAGNWIVAEDCRATLQQILDHAAPGSALERAAARALESMAASFLPGADETSTGRMRPAAQTTRSNAAVIPLHP